MSGAHVLCYRYRFRPLALATRWPNVSVCICWRRLQNYPGKCRLQTSTFRSDCALILTSFWQQWDFSSAALHRPKTHGNNASHGAARRSSMGSTLSLLDRYGHNRPSSSTRRQSSGMDRPMPMSGSGSAIASAQGYGATNHEAIAHTAPPKSEVAILQPVVVRLIELILSRGNVSVPIGLTIRIFSPARSVHRTKIKRSNN